jgi:Domain of unknown function (DUF5069)
VNIVAPGPIETEMLSRFAGGSDDRKAAFAARVPLKRLGRLRRLPRPLSLSPPRRPPSSAAHPFLSTAAKPLFNLNHQKYKHQDTLHWPDPAPAAQPPCPPRRFRHPSSDARQGTRQARSEELEYNYNSPTDQHLVRFLGFDPNALLKELAAGKGDGEILAWVLETPRRRADRGKSKPGRLTSINATRIATPNKRLRCKARTLQLQEIR